MKYHLAENDYRRDVVQIKIFRININRNHFHNRNFRRMYLFAITQKTAMEINSLRGDLCTITDIVFFWNRHGREISFFFTTQQTTTHKMT